MERLSPDEHPKMPPEVMDLAFKAKGFREGRPVDADLLVAYIDDALPTEEMRRQVQLWIETEPNWQRAHDELTKEGGISGE